MLSYHKKYLGSELYNILSFDTKKCYKLIKILQYFPFTKYMEKLLYLRLRMPQHAQLFPDIDENGLATLRAKLYLGYFDVISLNDAISKTERLNLKEKERILKELITVNPVLALKLYQFFKIENNQYFYLKYTFVNKVQAVQFYKEVSANALNANFNAYNYHLKENNFLDANRSLLTYFTENSLMYPIKKDSNKPLYIDNLSANTPIKKYSKSSKISIIMTAKNEEKLIHYALKSLILQSYHNIEIIFIDDASSDETVSIVFSTCKELKFSNIKIIQMKKNVGTFVSKNIALLNTTGDIITFHDADDWSHPLKLELQAKELVSGNKLASISEMLRIRPDGSLFSKQIYPLNQTCMISLMFKREVFEQFGFFYTDLIGADSEYYERILAYYGEEHVDKIKKVLTFAAHRDNSLMTSNTPDFGVSKKRIKDWEECRSRQMKIFFNNQSPFIEFTENRYEYDILNKI